MLLLEIGWPLLSGLSIDTLMLIIFHHLSYFEFAFTLNKMKSWGYRKSVNESEIASWNKLK